MEHITLLLQNVNKQLHLREHLDLNQMEELIEPIAHKIPATVLQQHSPKKTEDSF